MLFVALLAIPRCSFICNDKLARNLRPLVAQIARHIGVRPIQLEIRVYVVVELRRPPIVGSVALPANYLVARALELPLMHIFMARFALPRRRGERHLSYPRLLHNFMAARALYRHVSTRQRKLRVRMVEEDRLLPVLRLMAPFARERCRQISVRRFVAIQTMFPFYMKVRELFLFLRHMAPGAGNCRMRAR